MTSAGIKVFFFFIFFLLGVCAGHGAIAEETGTVPFQQQFEEIKTRLGAIESQQQSLLAQKDDILEQIDQVCIWVQHNGRGPKQKPKPK